MGISTDQSQAFTEVLDRILEAAKTQGMRQKDLAVRAGIAPETLSRMRHRGSGEFGLINALAQVVGLRLDVVPDNETLAALLAKRLF